MKKHLIRVWKSTHWGHQIAMLFLVIFLALTMVFVVDVLSHPGRSWTESLLVKMIVERRVQD